VFQILIVSFLLFDILWLIMADRRLVAIRAPKWTRILNLLFVLAMLAGISVALLLPRPLSREIQSHLPWAYLAALFLWHLMVAPLGLILLWLDNALSLALLAKSKLSKKPSPTDSSPASTQDAGRTTLDDSSSLTRDPGHGTRDAASSRLSRRDILSASLIAAPPLLLGGVSAAGLTQIGQIRVRRFDIPIKNLHPDLQGVTLAHISDTHYGRFTNQEFTDHLVHTVNDLGADLHLVTGDLIDSSLLDLDHGLAMLRSLKSKNPIYCCVGNHDLFMSKIGFIDRVRASQVVNLLVDENRTITLRGQPLQIFGMDWLRTDAQMAKTAQYLFRDKNPNIPSILLAHHPHAFDVAQPAGIDLTLAGHTHGGQVMLSPQYGPGPLMYRYWSGLYQKNDSSLIVSNGVGNWFPLRVNAPAEVLHLTLTKA
jgi:uncharacterized protein